MELPDGASASYSILQQCKINPLQCNPRLSSRLIPSRHHLSAGVHHSEETRDKLEVQKLATHKGAMRALLLRMHPFLVRCTVFTVNMLESGMDRELPLLACRCHPSFRTEMDHHLLFWSLQERLLLWWELNIHKLEH